LVFYKPTAKVIERAKNNKYLNFFERRTNESKVLLKSIEPDLIVLAGFY
jgi:folate-dependent phosphoribosylglycinamide formyltransferase PurN